MVYTPSVGDYVSWKEGAENTVRYGEVTKVDKSNYEVRPYDPSAAEITSKGIKTAEYSEYKDIASRIGPE